MPQDGHLHVGDPAFLGEPGKCRCPTRVKNAADERALTCQTLFERAYVDAGLPHSLARAVFLVFVQHGADENLVPLVVSEYVSST